MSKKELLFQEIHEKIGAPESAEKLALVFFEKRNQIRDILSQNKKLKKKYQNGNHTNWFLFLADYREALGIPRFIDLDLFNAFSEIIMTSGEQVSYDDFLKVMKKPTVVSKVGKNYQGPEVGKLIKNQGEYLAQGVVELVANAIDATLPESTIGRFGEGFYQSLKFLQGGDSVLKVDTKKQDEKAFQIHLRNHQSTNYVGSVASQKSENGTTIELQKYLSDLEQEQLISFVTHAFQTNKKVNVILNGEKINTLDTYHYYNGEMLTLPSKSVYIEINAKGFLVRDDGVGMSSEDVCEKLLYPTSSGKKRKNPDAMSEEELEKNTLRETAFFYQRFHQGEKTLKKHHENIDQKTQVRLQVGGVLIEHFDVETSYDIKEFCLEFPSFTWLPESRNKIELTKEVVVSLKATIEKIISKVKDETEQLMLLEIIGKTIKHLKSRESSKASTKSKYDILKVAKDAFKTLKNELEAKGKSVIASIEGIQDILPKSEDIVFVDEAFLNFEIAKIPKIQKLKNVSKSTKAFYQIEFDQNAPYDYLILPHGVIVNAKYTKDKKSLDLINTQVNLNTGYEHSQDEVFYGVIEDDEVSVQTEKQAISEKAQTVEESKLKEIAFKFAQNKERIFQEFPHIFGYKSEERMEEMKQGTYNQYMYMNGMSQPYYSYHQLVFAQVISQGYVKTIIPKFSGEFFAAFYEFAKGNTSEVVDTLISTVTLLRNTQNVENYILQLMVLLSDEKNAKYIIKYLDELDSLSQSDIEKIFAYFEGKEKEVVDDEEVTQDIITKIYQEGGEIGLEEYLKSIDPTISSVAFKTDQSSGNGIPIYKTLHFGGQSHLYFGSKLQTFEGGNEPICLANTFIYNGKVITVVGREGKSKLYIGGNNVLETYEIAYLRLENNILHYYYSDVEIFLGYKWLTGQIDLDDYFKIEENEKQESEYVKIYRKYGYKFFCAYIAKESIVGNEKTCTILNNELAYTVFNAHNSTYSIYIGDEIYAINGITEFGWIGSLMNFKGKLVVLCRHYGRGEFVQLYIGQYSCAKKIGCGNHATLDVCIIDEKLHIGYLGYLEGTSFIIRKELVLDSLPGEESEYFIAYKRGGAKEFAKYILSLNTDISDGNILGVYENGVIYIARSNKGVYFLFYNDKKISIQGEHIFDDLRGIHFRNGKICGKIKKFEEFQYEEIDIDIQELLEDTIDNLENLSYSEIYNTYGYDTLLEIIKKAHPEIEKIRLSSDIDGCDLVYESQNKNGTWSLYIGRQKLEFNGKSEFYSVDRINEKDGTLKGLYKENKGELKRTFAFDLSTLKKKETTFLSIDITKNYSPKILSFVEFLCKGGEFLGEKEMQIVFESETSLLLTDIIGISRHFSDDIEQLGNDDDLNLLEKLKERIEQKLRNRTPFQRNITSTIDGQDRSSMIWLRESVQNSRDAILKAKRGGKNMPNIDEIHIDFYQNNGYWISSISDSIGMSSYEVFKYLLTPGKSGKEHDETATGMFGQGFYSLTIGAKEVLLKTSTGNGKTTYIQLIPVYNDNRDIIDFEISYDIKDEQFQGTLIERIDEEEGIAGNLGALVGIHNISKYVGNVDDIDIYYNGKKAINKTDITTLETQNIGNIGTLTLKQNKDKQERLTKDNLFISEIKDEYKNFFPNWMQEYIQKNGYSLDLPPSISLTKTRNAITDFEQNIEMLRPHIFHIFIRQIVKDYLDGKVKIPMMPLDYYGLDIYETEFDGEIVALASQLNNGGVLTQDEMEILQDKNKMVQFLIHLQVFHNGETISIRELKQKRDEREKLRQHTQNTYALNHNATGLNASMERGDRRKMDVKKDSEKQVFLETMQKEFAPLTNRLFGCEIEFGFYQRKDKDEGRAADYGFDSKGNIYFHFNDAFWGTYKSDPKYKTIELITHEYTHLVEKFVKGLGVDFENEIIASKQNIKEILGENYHVYIKRTGFGSHQKELEHEHSFERIQRQMLKMMQREGL